MDKLKAIAIGFLFCCALVPVWCQNQSFRVDIRSAQGLVKSGETFRVDTAVRNVGTTEQEFPVFTCSWFGQWMVDNPAVFVNSHNCMQNIRFEKRLKPGQALENSLEVHILPDADLRRRREITFRLGFDTTGYYGTRKPGVKYPAIWSNAVTIIVTSD
jgi:hypothetical protein